MKFSARPIPFALALAFVLFAAFYISGCAGEDEAAGPPPGEAAPPSGPAVGPETAPAPGVYDLDDGRIQAVGYLLYEPELEGGFWFLGAGESLDPPGDDYDPTAFERVMVLSNADEFPAADLDAFEGDYLSVIGAPFEGASIRMAGPEIVAEELSFLAEDASLFVDQEP